MVALRILGSTLGALVVAALGLVILDSIFLRPQEVEESPPDAAWTAPLRSLAIGSVAAAIDTTARMILVPHVEGVREAPVTFETLEGTSLELRGRSMASGDRIDLTDVSPGSTLELRFSSPGRTWPAYDLVFGNLPVLQLQAPEIEEDAKRPATFRLSSPKPEEQIEPRPIGLEYRGATSQRYPKRSLELEFSQPARRGQDTAVRLLDLRRDEDWILDAAYIDRTLMRNRVAQDLFRDISRAGPRKQRTVEGRFVELFLNQRYWGVYVLSEKVDRALLNLDPGVDRHGYSLIYKAVGLAANFSSDYRGEPKESWTVGYVKIYPKHDEPELWNPLAQFVEFVATSTRAEFAAQIEAYIDPQSVLNYHLLCLAVDANDNLTKNYFLARQKQGPFLMLPWDVDASFGRRWNTALSKGEMWWVNHLLNRLTRMPNYRADLKSRWRSLRQTLLSHEAMYARFDTYYGELTRGGALQRNFERWPIQGKPYVDDATPEDDLALVRSFLETRLAFVDLKMETLGAK